MSNIDKRAEQRAHADANARCETFGVVMWHKLSTILPALVLLLAPAIAGALGLGEIELRSALNEPLAADIELISATPEEVSRLRVEIASRETFERYGLDRPEYLGGLRFRVETRGARQVLSVSSSEPMREPFVTFLVEAIWPSGQLIREYTVLLDPPTFVREQPAAPAPIATPSAGPQADSAVSGTVTRPVETFPEPAALPEPAPVTEPSVIEPEPPAAFESEPVATPEPFEPEPLPEPESFVPDSSFVDSGEFIEGEIIYESEPYTLEEGAPLPPDGILATGDVGVQRGDTLWNIAQQSRAGSVSVNQAMIAIFEANPDAFLGNINRLKAGAILRIPDFEVMGSVENGRALAAVREMNEEWSDTTQKTADAPTEAAPADAPAEAAEAPVVAETAPPPVAAETAATKAVPEEDAAGRLKLVAPDVETSEEVGVGVTTEPDAEESVAADTQVQGAEGELTEDERRVELESADLAAMQERLAAEQAAEAGDTPAEEAAPTVPVVQTTEEPGLISGLIETITGVLSSIWIWLGLGALAVLATAALLLRRGGTDESVESWEEMTRVVKAPSADAEPHERTVTQLAPMTPGDDSILVEESGPAAAAPVARRDDQMVAPSASGEYPFEDTLAGETAIKLDESDPLAEADFHMAYGLYDQAADLVKSSLTREPERRDLRMKLLEIYFVWGNKSEFAEEAGRLRESMPAPDADWDKVVIMGKQICPEDELFTAVAQAPTDMDLDLAVGTDTHVDLDFDPAELTDNQSAPSIDLDFGEALAADMTGQQAIPSGIEQAADGGIDFPLGESLDFGAAADDDEETSALDVDELQQQIEASLAKSDESPGGTGEDVDLDLGALGAAGGAAAASVAAVTGILSDAQASPEPVGESGDDLDLSDLGLDLDLEALTAEPTAEPDLPLGDSNVDLDLGDLALGSTDTPESTDQHPLISEPGMLGEGMTSDLAGADIGHDPDKTAEFFAQDDMAVGDNEQTAEFLTSSVTDLAGSETGLDLNLGFDDDSGEDVTRELPTGFDSDETVSTETYQPEESGVDFDLGGAIGDTGSGGVGTAEVNEVGTKLDLARAYLDMGDPDGARSILEEVIEEGDANQQQEARGLISSIS